MSTSDTDQDLILCLKMFLDLECLGKNSFGIAVCLLRALVRSSCLYILAYDNHAQEGELEKVTGEPEKEPYITRLQRSRQPGNSEDGEQPCTGHGTDCCRDDNGDSRIDPGIPVAARALIISQYHSRLLALPDMGVRDVLVETAHDSSLHSQSSRQHCASARMASVFSGP
jgi:hypothetical protein